MVFKKNLGEKSVVVGALYSRVRDITAKFSYTQGQNSSLGVAFSAGLADASFSQEGTHSVSSSAGAISRVSAGIRLTCTGPISVSEDIGGDVMLR
jgi:hypothetical protein